eukprot:GHVT01103516.1.p1 GENE.GHVT01103516.1~~GHVT01103516.1.p1  ORF type:complete len:108 (+),score=11.95 GHVT01103516.1:107-430(+)
MPPINSLKARSLNSNPASSINCNELRSATLFIQFDKCPPLSIGLWFFYRPLSENSPGKFLRPTARSQTKQKKVGTCALEENAGANSDRKKKKETQELIEKVKEQKVK